MPRGEVPHVGQPAFYRRRKRRGYEIGQLLLKSEAITAEHLREALRLQREQGGHVGAILRRMGACTSREITQALVTQKQLLAVIAEQRMSLVEQVRESPSLLGLKVHCKPLLVTVLLVLTDALALLLGAAVVGALTGQIVRLPFVVLGVVAVVPLCLSVYAAAHIYAVPRQSPPEELRRTSLTTTAVFLGFWLVSFLAHRSALPVAIHVGWFLGWVAALFLVPLLRFGTRSLLSKQPWGSHPVVIIGASKVGRAVVSTLQRHPELGLKPVAVLDDDPTRQGTLRAAWGDDDVQLEPVSTNAPPSSIARDLATSVRKQAAWSRFAEIEGVPILGGVELAPLLGQRLGIKTVVISDPELDSQEVLQLIEAYVDSYTNVLVIPDLYDLTQFGAPMKDIGGVLGIEVRRQLLLRGPRFAKRLMDLGLTLVGSLFVFPILLVLGIWVALDSPGGAFYRQKRLGQDGVRFFALKFRTMYGDGEQRLQAVLDQDPRRRAEYDEFHKINDDPRVTRAGKFLRKYSLDELPQIWSVLVGDMSLVGPRPYIDRELPEMNQQEAVILRVKPGITGFWQVTERNEASFERRVQLDVAYVRSWSPWLDIYVLARTVPVVLGGTGS